VRNTIRPRHSIGPVSDEPPSCSIDRLCVRPETIAQAPNGLFVTATPQTQVDQADLRGPLIVPSEEEKLIDCHHGGEYTQNFTACKRKFYRLQEKNLPPAGTYNFFL